MLSIFKGFFLEPGLGSFFFFSASSCSFLSPFSPPLRSSAFACSFSSPFSPPSFSLSLAYSASCSFSMRAMASVIRFASALSPLSKASCLRFPRAAYTLPYLASNFSISAFVSPTRFFSLSVSSVPLPSRFA